MPLKGKFLAAWYRCQGIMGEGKWEFGLRGTLLPAGKWVRFKHNSKDDRV